MTRKPPAPQAKRRAARHEAAEEDLPEPPQVRRLRRLVSGLTLASIIAVLAIAATVFIRLGLAPQAPEAMMPPSAVTAGALSLPADERITVIGQSGGVIIAVTEDGTGALRLRRWDGETGALRSVTTIRRE